MRFPELSRYRTGGTDAQMQLSVPVPHTPSGRAYRYSPNEAAEPRHFVLGDAPEAFDVAPEARARMKQEPRSPYTVCPYSGVIDNDQAFVHPADKDAALEMVKHAAVEDVRAAINDMLKGVASRSRFIKVEQRSSPRRVRPTFQRRDLLRLLACDHCGRDYGVYAIGLFCPDCGAPNVRLHFAREVELVDAQVRLAETVGAENEELAYRLLGNAHEDVLTAFEATLKTVYVYALAQRPIGAPEAKAVKNDFQNVERATKRYAELGFGPFDGLDDGQRAALNLNIQKRHVIGHNLGIIDAKFAEAARDARVGETVELVAGDIRLFAALSQSVVDRLDAWLGDAPAPRAIAAPPVDAPPPPGPAPILKGSRLGRLAQEIGLWLAKNDARGSGGPFDVEGLQTAFGAQEPNALEDALAELRLEGCLRESRTLHRSLRRFLVAPDLYVVFDTAAFGTNPASDAAELAQRILDGGEAIDIPTLHAATGWDRRRFNPAFHIIMGQIDPGRVINTLGSQYAAQQMHLVAEDRVRLQRFIGR